MNIGTRFAGSILLCCVSLICCFTNVFADDSASDEMVNIALPAAGTTVTASGQYSKAPAYNVNDGRVDNYWRPLTGDTADNEVWLTLDFGREAAFSRIKTDMSGMEAVPGSEPQMWLPQSYEVKYLNDASYSGTYGEDSSKWTTFATRTSDQFEAEGKDDVSFENITASRITFVFHVDAVIAPNVPSPLVREVEVYGLADENPVGQQVPQVDLTTLEPDDFADPYWYLTREYDTDVTLMGSASPHIPYYLANFHQLANSVVQQGPDKGYISIPVWRSAAENAEHNARIMENVLSLVYFYTADETWNPYYGSPAVREKAESAIQFWLSLQREDGLFEDPSYSEGFHMGTTAFQTKFMGETLRQLHMEQAPPINPDLLERLEQSDRRAIMVLLTRDDMFDRGILYENQYGNVWSGALAYLSLFPEDTEMKTMLEERLTESEAKFQSPAGFWYEHESTDWAYNLKTHRSNTRTAWYYAKGTEFQDHYTQTESAWYDWLSYNAVPEPDGSSFILNRSIESRRLLSSFQRLDNEIAEVVPLARAFAATTEEIGQNIAQQRALLQQSWPDVGNLSNGFNSYNPYVFTQLHFDTWAPTPQQHSEATALLPYFASDRFNHLRIDAKNPLITAFARQPGYYAAFNAGQKVGSGGGQQRFGLGLLWSPNGGTFLQNQTGTADAAWGTSAPGMARPYEGDSFVPELSVNGNRQVLQPGVQDLPAGEMAFQYALGDSGNKSVRFAEEGITVSINHEGDFVEQLPLLTKTGDGWSQEEGKLLLTRGGVQLEVTFSPEAQIEINPTTYVVQNFEVKTVALKASGSLTYTIRIIDDSIIPSDPPEVEPPAEQPINLALAAEGTTVTASSRNSKNPESFTNDGDHLYHWRPLTADTSDREVWLSLDFGKDEVFDRVALDMSGMDGDSQQPHLMKLPNSYQVKVLTDSAFQGTYDDDPSKWQAIASRTKADYETDGIDDIRFDAVTASRLVVTFDVYEAVKEVPAPRIREIGVYRMDEPAEVVVQGEKGQNEWYVSDVVLSFTDRAGSVQYRIDGGGWTTYAEDVLIQEDGEHVVEYRSVGPSGQEGEIKSMTVKIDQTPPVLILNPNPSVIFPPNQKLMPVHINADYGDERSGVASVVLTSVSSNEADRDANDIQAAELGSFDQDMSLRAFRSDWNHEGRVYTLTYTAADHAGNTATVECRVAVPHDRGE